MAGEHPLYDVNDVFASYYRKYKKITEYVNNIYYFGDSSIPILERSILPLREQVNKYRDETLQYLDNVGGKYLVQTHDFLYFAFNSQAKIPEIKGAKKIC